MAMFSVLVSEVKVIPARVILKTKILFVRYR